MSRIVLVLVSVAAVGAAGYVSIMFDGSVSLESAIEGANFSVQTLTTVGYGNWVPSTTIDQSRILAMKAYSIPIMLAGATLFAVIVGIVANRLSS